jgi:hypothetical protein
MKKSLALALTVMALIMVDVMSGYADGPRGGGGGYHGGGYRGGGGGYYGGGYRGGGWGGAYYRGGAWAGTRYGGGVWVGPGWGGWGAWGPGWGAWGIPLYQYPYYQAPQVIIQEQPPVFIQPDPQEEEQGYWYYCRDSRTYYPYVKECPSGWMKVVPAPSQTKPEE